MLRSYRNL